jgi:hypothetical protein
MLASKRMQAGACVAHAVIVSISPADVTAVATAAAPSICPQAHRPWARRLPAARRRKVGRHWSALASRRLLQARLHQRRPGAAAAGGSAAAGGCRPGPAAAGRVGASAAAGVGAVGVAPVRGPGRGPGRRWWGPQHGAVCSSGSNLALLARRCLARLPARHSTVLCPHAATMQFLWQGSCWCFVRSCLQLLRGLVLPGVLPKRLPCFSCLLAPAQSVLSPKPAAALAAVIPRMHVSAAAE